MCNDTINNESYVEEKLRGFHGFSTNYDESFPYIMIKSNKPRNFSPAELSLFTVLIVCYYVDSSDLLSWI